MIQPAACLSLSALALPADAAGSAAGEGAEGANFGALLALQGLAIAPDGEAALLPAALPGVAAAAKAPASPGKILPPVLPVEQTAVTPALAVPVKPGGPATPVSAKAAKERSPARPEGETATNEGPAVSGNALPAAPDLPTPAYGIAVLAAPPAPVGIAPVQAAPRDRPAGSGPSTTETPDPIPPEQVRPLLPAQTARLTRVQAGVQVQEPPESPPSPQGAARPTAARLARPAEEVRIALALPRTLGAPQVAGERKAASPDSPAELTATLSLPSAPASTAHFAAIQAAPQVRPHDFAALIDRLSAAREAVQPQTISITVAHQDFGSVRLHFRPEEAGLSVAMSSADPDFARAAAAAPPAVLPANASAEASFGHSHSDGAAGQAGTQAGGGQSRGASTSQREGHGQPQANPSPRGQQQRPAPRPGIFA